MTDHESRSGGGGHARLAIIAAALVVILGSSGVAWFAYNKGFYRASDQLAPLVQAQDGATKRRPEQPGGLEIPNQDKLVFDRLAPGENGERVERLLPPPEEPLAKPEPVPVAVAESAAETETTRGIAGAIIDSLASPAAEAPPPVEAPPLVEAPPVAAPTTESLLAEAPAPPPVPQAEPQAEVEPKTESLLAGSNTTPSATTPQIAAPPAPPEAPQVAAKPNAATEIRPAAPPSSAWRIQLASISSDKGAKTEWQRLQGRHQELLQNLQLNVQKADLSRGTFYRIQAGPLADRAAAQRLCASLKQRQQDCLVVSP